MDKSSSFSGTPKHSDKDSEAFSREEKEEALHHLPKILEDVDHFLHNTTEETVPECFLLLPKLLDSMMDKYNEGRQIQNHRSKFGHDPEDDQSFLDVLHRITNLSATLTTSSALDKTSSTLEKAMCFLERDFIALLQHPKSSTDTNNNNHNRDSQSKKTTKKTSSFGSLQLQDSDLAENESPRANPGENEEDEEFSPEKVSILNKIATTMICAGYEAECCMAFANFRRSAFKTVLQRFGYVSVCMEDIHRMQWESLEGEIATWNKVVRHCTTMLLNAERRLYDSVFANQNSISQTLFSDLARAVIIHFLNFAQGVVLTKPSAEKLFKFLDMYETLRDMEPAGIIDDELAYEIATTKSRIVELVVAMFFDLENSIKSDNQRVAVPNGVVHPLARYVMNYLKYACEYKDTLEQVFQQFLDVNNSNQKSNPDQGKMEDGMPKTSPLAVQLMTIMDLLDANVERKSKLYRDPALRYVFLMNNGRYIVQKIKGCTELHESMGDNWCRKKQSGLRLYHKSYQRETWSKVLQCLNPENRQGSGSGNKVSKQVLKERFQCFNAIFEEIHKTQSTWVVSDEQLRSELRVSITALVIPAYRSFFGRFKHHLQSGRQVDKYIKYHPEDIETLIEDLFDGNATSMPRRRT